MLKPGTVMAITIHDETNDRHAVVPMRTPEDLLEGAKLLARLAGMHHAKAKAETGGTH